MSFIFEQNGSPLNIWRLLVQVFLIFAPTATAHCSNPPLKCFRDCITDKGLSLNSIVTQDSNATLYAFVNHQWTLKLPHVYPLAYFLPTTTTDVQTAVRCATKLNIPLVPKGGGHSFECYSCGNNVSIVMDFKEMISVEVDQVKKTTTIEPGALIGPIAVKLWNSGGYGFPLSGCLRIGVAGFTLGGGSGSFAPAYGLAIDRLIEMTMVAADGKAYTVSATKNPNLFWGLRGVGSGLLGIVTKFKFKMFDASKIKVTYLNNYYDISRGADIIEAYQRWATWTNKYAISVGSGLNFGPINNTIVLRARAFYLQDDIIYRESNATFISKYREIFPEPVTSSTTFHPNYMDFVLKTHASYIVTNNTLPQTEADLANLNDKLILPRYLYRKARFVSKIFSSAQLEPVGEVLSRMPVNGFVSVSLAYEGGRVSKLLPNATSYVHRTPLYILMAQYNGPYDPVAIAEAKTWIAEFVNVSKFMDTGKTYQNYVDGERLDYLSAYYGSNLNRLVGIKRHWDPDNYFRNPQSLPTKLHHNFHYV